MKKGICLGALLALAITISNAQNIQVPKVNERVTIHIWNLYPDNNVHRYVKNENWNGFYSGGRNNSKGALVHDAQGSFGIYVEIDSLGLGSGYRNDVTSDTFSFYRCNMPCIKERRYDVDSIISLSDYGSQSAMLYLSGKRQHFRPAWFQWSWQNNDCKDPHHLIKTG